MKVVIARDLAVAEPPTSEVPAGLQNGQPFECQNKDADERRLTVSWVIARQE